MTPQEREQFEQMQKELQELRTFKRSLEAFGTIPLNVHKAFQKRLKVNEDQTPLTLDPTNPLQVKAVNEAGSSTYNVMSPADDFAFVTIDGIRYNVPLFNV